MSLTAQQIITNFGTYTDDNSELATTEQINVMNRILRKIANERVWSFLKVSTSGVTDSTGSITLPTNFGEIAANYAVDPTIMRADTPVVFVGAQNKVVYPVIPIELAIQANFGALNYPIGGFYGLTNQYAYIDYANNKLVVNGSNGDTCYYTYKKTIDEVLLPVNNIPLPQDYADVVLYGMLIDDTMIQKIDALKNLLPVNQEMYKDYLKDLRAWDSRALNNY